ncbi:MAG: MBL fold metallo-hydrolase [Synergistales bacterium]|nr:MBL fold metallo-hydrolase [Synergistales bacterium]
MLRIVTLVENTAGEHHALINEHGISFYIEKDGHKILFDTGQSDAFLKNAAQMRIDLSDLEIVVLSHGHYDHSGGFRHLISLTGSFQMKVGEGFFNDKYALRKNAYDFLGNNFDESFLQTSRVPYSFVTRGLEELLPGIFILSGFPRIHKDEKVNPRFFLLKEGRFVHDRFDDEILLALDSPGGLIVLLGCSHPGMKNMMDAVKQRLGRPIHAVLGGTHLVESKGEGLERSLEYLNDPEIGIIGVSHCTGEEAMSRLKEKNPRYSHNMTGSSLYFD